MIKKVAKFGEYAIIEWEETQNKNIAASIGYPVDETMPYVKQGDRPINELDAKSRQYD